MGRRAPTGSGRLARVTLRDVPLEQREAAATALTEQAARVGDLRAALLIRHAVLSPSDRVYLVPEESVVRALGRLP